MFLPFQVVPTKNMLSDPCDPKTEARNFQLDNICLPSEKAISCISGAGAGSGWQFSVHFPPRSQWWRRRACFPFWSLSECRGNFCTLFDYHRMRKILGHISEVSKPHISVLFDRLETMSAKFWDVCRTPCFCHFFGTHFASQYYLVGCRLLQLDIGGREQDPLVRYFA